MDSCAIDPSIPRVESNGFKFPLGAYPVENLIPKPGYTIQFEPADGGDGEGDWEEWPDRYVFDAVLSADRVEPLCRMLFALLPGRLFPILDVLGVDAFREIDPYIAYDLVPSERFLDSVRQFRDFLFEDGMVGFGAMSQEPFLYIFIDEHKIITIRAQVELKERIERILHAFDLEQVDDPAGADAAAHEHRGALLVADDRPDLLNPEEIVERLRDAWELVLNVDPEANVDDEGNTLGITLWRCLARCEPPDATVRYAEVVLRASCLREAEESSFDAVERITPGDIEWDNVVIVSSNRIKPEQMKEIVRSRKKPELRGKGDEPLILATWLNQPG
ncbi:MAG: hypothetical protein HBSAPP03_17000 [Phycisphaerae bacterium]|nr:MAG: hypothetical protein HBSAPP03_17000 [Phycisphaerae bacterium]